MNSQISCSARGIQWISALHLFAPWQLFFFSGLGCSQIQIDRGIIGKSRDSTS